MIKELAWDSIFFKRKIGELTINTRGIHNIETALKKAKADGFKYIICKLCSQQTSFCRLLESSGFYLSDIGVTWAIETGEFLSKLKPSKINRHVRVAADKDIPALKKLSKSLFTYSRFYNDPFFSKKDADSLYQAWIENSVKGRAADLMLCIQDKGFVTCKKTKGNAGEIVLIGIKKGFRNKSAGTLLLKEALKWFNARGVHSVSARTQLQNLNAMNFYLKSGFYIKGYDIVLARVLQ